MHRRGEVVDIQAVVFDYLFAVELEKEEREKYGRGLMTDKEWYVLCTGIRFIYVTNVYITKQGSCFKRGVPSHDLHGIISIAHKL